MSAPSPTLADAATAATVSDDAITAGTTGGYAAVDTPNGPFTVIADDADRVLASGWTDDPAYLAALIHRSLRPETLQRSAALGSLTDAVTAYYAGEVDAPSRVEVVQLSGGTFLNKAWDALRLVEPGRPVTYTEFAERAGEPAAVRAAATACARNAAALFVPCHRVKRSDGSLGGFRYGLETKKWLLDFEAPATD
ncbi:methylated-DNA--[protein]-cysteine S-methyltransferase [Gordonia sp. C13]|uniref:methylated-DNA--[protein]-cysteine S-methyltransferase n=1 Tax=Gordonia sp. C13 TaxID=2935078 RepID=UPI00200A409C|nr:methylated-DNA--[protein]-cysteine S-methyltransferase [Gordonia sp. C13]MCK8615813.1 methylated-DNA--[protein]-cysteine S-methyltransferase [Gordonia sp. C13]